MPQYPGQISRAISQSTGYRKKYLTHVQGEQNYENINPDGSLTINISTNYHHCSFHQPVPPGLYISSQFPEQKHFSLRCLAAQPCQVS